MDIEIINNISIAIYSANFGNYRNELKNGIDNIHVDKNIDYYFFTDDANIQSNVWKIIQYPLQSKLEFINSFRNTSKYIKWIVPEILKKYNIIIWIDTKCLELLDYNREDIIQLFQTEKEKDIFFIKHFFRDTAHQELQITMNYDLESREYGNKFLKKIKDIKFKTHLPDTMYMIYKNIPETVSLFKNIYDTLLNECLKRDQNIIQYVILNDDYETKVSYFLPKTLDKYLEKHR